MAKIKAGPLLGNWVEDRALIEVPKDAGGYVPTKDKTDYSKLKPERRINDFRKNKLLGEQGYASIVLIHDSHQYCNNYATTNNIVYGLLPKPLCGPAPRKYSTAKHAYVPQPDFTECYGNLADWGLQRHSFQDWPCTGVSDYARSLYDDSFTAPTIKDMMNVKRKAIDNKFTKSFGVSMSKPSPRPPKLMRKS